MKNVSKNIFLITLLIVVNLAIFLFCKIHTDEGNYIWGKTDQNRQFLISVASIDLMRINYYIYANCINILLLGIYFLVYDRKILGVLIVFLGIGVYYGGNKLFENQLIDDYYVIFQNQTVPADFVMEPIKSAGNGIGSYLMKDISNKKAPLREQAIIGVGEVHYHQASDALNLILLDITEPPKLRAEAYASLIKMKTEKASTYASIFIESSHPIVDEDVIRYIKLKSNSNQK